jgi:outer membrane lipoprotein carrier protein
MKFFKQLFVTFFIAACACLAGATGLNSLENFVKTVKTGKADFTQVVTPPAKEGQMPRIKTSSGTFEFSRPGLFRFVYKKPFEQTIVADGQTLWLYDVDLNQVTARKQAQVLGSTPAALVASAADLKALQADFILANDVGGVAGAGKSPDKDGLEWLTATPKTKDGQVQTIRIGFKAGSLAALEILDSFGQTSRVSFSGFVANAALDASIFQFTLPAGADVMRQ